MVISETFTYNEQIVKFDLRGQSLMVNATHMARIFGKKVDNFLQTETTEAFIRECCKDENFPLFEDVQVCLNRLETDESETDEQKFERRKLYLVRVIYGGRNNGTWMHRILALKFAAWLSPAFDVWVFRTIDELLFKHARMLSANIQETVERRKEIDRLREELLSDERFMRLEILRLEDRKATYQRGKVAKEQMHYYKSLEANN